MKRFALVLAGALLLGLASPAAAIDFPEQGKPHSCAVVQSLPKDITLHLLDVSPIAAQHLFELVGDACLGG